MTVLLAVLACALPFAVAAWYRDANRHRYQRDRLADALRELHRADHTILVLRRLLRDMWQRNERLQADLEATRSIAADNLRAVWALTEANERLANLVELRQVTDDGQRPVLVIARDQRGRFRKAVGG